MFIENEYLLRQGGSLPTWNPRDVKENGPSCLMNDHCSGSWKAQRLRPVQWLRDGFSETCRMTRS